MALQLLNAYLARFEIRGRYYTFDIEMRSSAGGRDVPYDVSLYSTMGQPRAYLTFARPLKPCPAHT